MKRLAVMLMVLPVLIGCGSKRDLTMKSILSRTRGTSEKELIRDMLISIVWAEFMPRWFSFLFGWWFELLTIGFLPENFRDKMGLEFTPWKRRVFNAHNKAAKAISDHLPKVLREFPLNFFLWDVRWRIRTGRPLV